MKKLLIIILCCFLLTACSGQKSSVLDDTTCDAPCWREIIPGRTSLDESLKYILGMTDVAKDSVKLTDGNYGFWQNGILWSFDHVIENSGELFFNSDEVIFLKVSIAKNQIVSLSEVFSKYGEPDLVYSTYGILETMMKSISLIYSNGICVELRTQNINPTRVEPNSDIYYTTIVSTIEIKSISFFDPNLSSNVISTSCYWPIEEKYIQKWNGFGKYFVFPGL